MKRILEFNDPQNPDIVTDLKEVKDSYVLQPGEVEDVNRVVNEIKSKAGTYNFTRSGGSIIARPENEKRPDPNRATAAHVLHLLQDKTFGQVQSHEHDQYIVTISGEIDVIENGVSNPLKKDQSRIVPAKTPHVIKGVAPHSIFATAHLS